MDKRLDPYRFDVGTARVEPETPIVAGAFFTRRIIFTAGKYGVDEGAQILVCKRLSSDMEIPQFEDPAASGYVSVSCSNEDVGLSLSYQEQGYLDDWRSGVAVRVAKGYLCEGDEVTLVLGDTAGGGPGIRAQTFPESPPHLQDRGGHLQPQAFLRAGKRPRYPRHGRRARDLALSRAPRRPCAGRRSPPSCAAWTAGGTRRRSSPARCRSTRV